MNEMFGLTQLMNQLTGMSFIWVQLGLIGVLSAVAIWRREIIVSVGALRMAFTCLALSFILPPILTGMFPAFMEYIGVIETSSRSYGGRTSPPLLPELSRGLFGAIYALLSALQPLLIGFSILSLSRAVVPKFIPPPQPARPAPSTGQEPPK